MNREDDSIAQQAGNNGEEAAHSALRTARTVRHIHQIQRQGLSNSNPLSRNHQRREIQNGYRAALRASYRNYGAQAGVGSGARHGAAALSDKAHDYLHGRKHWAVILLLGGLLIFMVQGISALSPLLESGVQMVVMSTYPASEEDIREAERIYAEKEMMLQNEINQYAVFHPGYDEYVIDAMSIWHDPYVLIAILSTYRGGEAWTIDDVYDLIDFYFDWQYELTETVTTSRRWRTEFVDGEETQVWFDKTTCTVTLKNKDLSHAPVYTMSKENMGIFAMYMATHGNMDGTFSGPNVSVLKEPLMYDAPQAYLDADPKFALLIEEANRRIGYPYVWGGHSPETSFDCSGFITWAFNSTGVLEIGQHSASGLYGACRHISAEDAKPGDLVFFEKTVEGEDGITHVGLYVGDNMMFHFGSPGTYADLTSSYYASHLYGFGRLYEH